MKKRYRSLICLILLGGLFLSFTGCNSLPPSGEAVPPAEPALPEPAPLEADPEETIPPEELLPEEPPEFIVPGEDPRERPLGALPEPVPPPLAEADLPLPPPAEGVPGAALPEPPVWTPPPLPEPVEEPAWESTLPPPPPPAPPERAVPVQDVECPPVPPEPPEFVGTAEEPPPHPEPRRPGAPTRRGRASSSGRRKAAPIALNFTSRILSGIRS
jgi:hypothetical protein